MAAVRPHGVLAGRGGAVCRGRIVRHDAVVAIIPGAFTVITKHIVCGGDVGEAGGCVGVVAVAVRMVGE